MKNILLGTVLLLVACPLFAEVRVVVVGVTPEMDLVERWAAVADTSVTETPDYRLFRIESLGVSVVVPASTASLASIATTLYQADAAMIAMDATVGPLPSLREHTIAARQASVPVVAMMFANVDSLWSVAAKDARELLALEDDEFRNVLSLYGMGGASTPLFHDSVRDNRGPTSAVGGLGAAGRFFAELAPVRDARPDFEQQQYALAQVYFLADEEANGNGIRTAKEWSLELWCEGSSTTVDVYAVDVYGPGDIGAVDIRATEAFSADEGSRILLFDDGHIVGIGVLTMRGN